VTDGAIPVRYLRFAEQDLFELYDYVARDAPEAAATFIERIDAAVIQLAAHPHLGPVVREERLRSVGFRYLPVGDHIVFYKVEDGSVIVYRVLHGARDWGRLL
jgi:toxin ParE1/3/4